jgi:hypothetical protein
MPTNFVSRYDGIACMQPAAIAAALRQLRSRGTQAELQLISRGTQLAGHALLLLDRE